MRRRPPRATRTYTCCPYTTLFRSDAADREALRLQRIERRDHRRTHRAGEHREHRLALQLVSQRARLVGEGAVEGCRVVLGAFERSEEHKSELKSLMRNSYAVFCLTKTNITHRVTHPVRTLYS